MQVGAQLYTLRDFIQTEKDFARSMKKVAEIGYQTVQISGAGPIGIKKLKEICDEYGLKIALTHTDPNRIVNDTEQVIEDHFIMDCDYIGIGAMPQKYRDPEWYPYFAEDYREAARKIAAAGKLLMYHNHNFEFEKIGGVTILEHLIHDFAPEEMGFTLDTYWVQAGGADIVKWIEHLKGRMPCVHLKDMAVKGMESKMAPVMEGSIDFAKVVPAFGAAGAKYLLVEQDVCEGSPFACLKKSYENLKALGYK